VEIATMPDLLSVLFVALWGTAGLVGGAFFRRVRRQQVAKRPVGKLPLEAARFVTLLVFLVLVIAASEVGRRGAVPGSAKTWAIIICVLGCVAGFAWPRRSGTP
jgi:protein-S-isoprenylcysteine O-methyltransferase Ste14